jgi:hypothetical protein
VPLNGRDELQLTPGVWYLAVQAGGSSNVRYRLLVSLGIITNLNCDGVLLSHTLAGGDWCYYRVLVPTNAFTSWNVTFAQTLGDVVMYVRDITPPGQGSTAWDYRHWQPDNKNFGPYPVVDSPGTTNLPCPPLRPGFSYYLGFRAVSDAMFSVSCTTNTDTIDYTNVIPFYNASVTNVIPAYSAAKYRIDVPADARRWIHTSTHSDTVYLYLEQGTVPKPPSEYHWYSGGAANSTLNQQLYNSSWPWRPGYMYFLLVTNTSAVPQAFVFNMNGRNAATDDGGIIPHFLTPFYTTNVLQLPVEQVATGTTYRLLASTNLIDWSGIQTSTPFADPATFTDPWATNYPYRFYRLVTP